MWRFFFFFNDTATTEIYTLSLHDALPIATPPVTWTSSAPPRCPISISGKDRSHEPDSLHCPAPARARGLLGRPRRATCRGRIGRARAHGAGPHRGDRPARHRAGNAGPQGGGHAELQGRRRHRPHPGRRRTDRPRRRAPRDAPAQRDRRGRNPRPERGGEGRAGPGARPTAVSRQRGDAGAGAGRGDRARGGGRGAQDGGVQPPVCRHPGAGGGGHPAPERRARRAGPARDADPDTGEPLARHSRTRRPGRPRRRAGQPRRLGLGPLRRRAGPHARRNRDRDRRRRGPGDRHLPRRDHRPRRGRTGERSRGHGGDTAESGTADGAGPGRGGARGRRHPRHGLRPLDGRAPRRAAPGPHRIPGGGPGRRRGGARGGADGGDRRCGVSRRRRRREGAAMKLTEFSVKHWQFTVVLFAMLAALGATSLLKIPRSEDPPIDFPTFTIVAVYPGASARDIERKVVKPVEDTLHRLDDIRSISSRIRPGVASIQIEFEAEQDAAKKYDDVVREVNAMRPGLPAELARLEIHKATTLDVNIVQVALVSELASYHVLDSLAEELEDRLTAVPGVRIAERWGAPERQVAVLLDLGRLAAVRLPAGQVLGAIAGESADIPGGSADAGLRSFSVRSSGSYESVDQVRNTVVRGEGGRLVRVGDVARVDWSYADSTYRARFNGLRAVFVTANQREGTTVQSVRNGIYSALDRFERELPPGVRLARGFDQAANVSHRLGRPGEGFLIALGPGL